MKELLILCLLAFFSFCQKSEKAPPKSTAFSCEKLCSSFWQGHLFGKVDELDDNIFLQTNIGEAPLFDNADHPEIQVFWSRENGHLTFCSSCGPITSGIAWLDQCENTAPISAGIGQVQNGGCFEFTPPDAFFASMGEDCYELHFDLQIECGR